MSFSATTRRRISALAPALVLLITGCAGHSPFRGTTDFTGAYRGDWTNVATGTPWNLNLTVDDSAAVTGTLVGSADGAGTIHGFITTSGKLTGKIDFADSSTPMKFGGSVAVTASDSVNVHGGLAGTVTTTMGDAKTTVNITTGKL